MCPYASITSVFTLASQRVQTYFTQPSSVHVGAFLDNLALLLKLDVHGPSILRANMPPRNFEEWYKTFDVKKTDKMYIEPKKRVVIW